MEHIIIAKVIRNQAGLLQRCIEVVDDVLDEEVTPLFGPQRPAGGVKTSFRSLKEPPGVGPPLMT